MTVRNEWSPPWRMILVMCAFGVLMTGVLLNVICNGGKPERYNRKEFPR